MDEMDDEAVRVGLRTRKLLNDLSRIHQLELSCFQAEVIAQTKSGLPLPKFDYLVELTLSRGPEFENHLAYMEALLELLHAAPSLKNLVFHMVTLCLSYKKDGFDYDAMASVPSCMISHLEKVEFIGFENWARQLNLAKFVMKHGAKLNKLSFPRCRMDRNRLLKKISRFSKASDCLTVDIN